MKNLVPGSQYDFEVYATSDCGNSLSAYLKGGTTVKGEHYFPDDFDIHCTVAFVIQIQFLNGNFFFVFLRNETLLFLASRENFLHSFDTIQSQFLTGNLSIS